MLKEEPKPVGLGMEVHGKEGIELSRGQGDGCPQRKTKLASVKRSAGGNLTMTHRVDPRGESFRIQSKEDGGPEERWEVRFSCKRYGHKEAGRQAWNYFWGALEGCLGEVKGKKNDYDFLKEALGRESWQAGKLGEDEICEVNQDIVE